MLIGAVRLDFIAMLKSKLLEYLLIMSHCFGMELLLLVVVVLLRNKASSSKIIK